MIGDADPEDAFDAGDAPELSLAVLERIAGSLEAGDDGRRQIRRDDALRLVMFVGRLAGVDRARLAAVRARLEAV